MARGQSEEVDVSQGGPYKQVLNIEQEVLNVELLLSAAKDQKHCKGISENDSHSAWRVHRYCSDRVWSSGCPCWLHSEITDEPFKNRDPGLHPQIS